MDALAFHLPVPPSVNCPGLNLLHGMEVLRADILVLFVMFLSPVTISPVPHSSLLGEGAHPSQGSYS